MGISHGNRIRRAALAVCALGLLACSKQKLAPNIAHLEIVPQPEGAQTTLQDPPGIDLGRVPLYGVGLAHFKVKNLSTAILRISSWQVVSSEGGTFAVDSFPTEIPATQEGELVVSFVPQDHNVVGSATITLLSNAGVKKENPTDLQIKGIGLFVGNPKFEVCYGGQCFPQAGDCTDRGDGQNLCRLPTLAFGNVPLSTQASQEIRLHNVPAAGTCLAPPGSPDCTPVCRLRFDRDPGGNDLGVGLVPDANGFGIVGNLPVPFEIDVNDPSCNFSGELRVLLSYTAGDQPTDGATTLVLETNDPDAPFVEIPLSASAREAPVAVATLRACNPNSPSSSCSVDGEIHPLEHVYLDGRGSFDPTGLQISS